MRTVVDCHGHYLSCNMLLFATGMMLLWPTFCQASFLLATNVPHHAVCKTFLDKKYGTYSTVFPTTFLSFFLKLKSSVSPTNFTDVAFIGSNGM